MTDHSTVNRHTTYEIHDELAARAFRRDHRAVWTGEKRLPLKGEWYLSGNPVGAYRALTDLSIEFHIAELVKGTTEWRPLGSENQSDGRPL